MLRAFSKEGRVKDTIAIHGIMLERGTVANDSCYNSLVNFLCKEDPSEKVSKLLTDMIGGGFCPCLSELSKFISSQCNKRQWREAEELLNVILEKGLLPDSSCSLRICWSIIALADGMIQLLCCIISWKNKRVLWMQIHNVLLNGLLKERRVEEALRVFEYMRSHNLLNKVSFSAMISELSHENELRKAMKLSDEMLKMGLKPDVKIQEHDI